MRAALLIDFGSTCTKLTAVDLDARHILGTAQDFTTVQSDIAQGLENAKKRLEKITGVLSYDKMLACSSAAGGLKMAACGLVPSLTAEAARRAALGAGAKVVKSYAYQMTREDAEEIEHIHPDIFLLSGGTDGGNKEAILANARTLAQIKGDFPIVVAGNRAAAEEVKHILSASSHQALITQNVMPAFNALNIEPAQQVIRSVFLGRIVEAKGLSHIQALTDNILMPTPAAVLSALSLLSRGTATQKGMGDLMAVDLGGATTDVYSIASGAPRDVSTLLAGLPEPFEKRTVEGDVGMRWSARGVVDAVGMPMVVRQSGLEESEIEALLQKIDDDKSLLPQGAAFEALDSALATLCVGLSLNRHAGHIEQVYTPMGEVLRQTGKDLRGIEHLIITGGALIHAKDCATIIKNALMFNDLTSLMPRNAQMLMDKTYILSAMGLLRTIDEEAALSILRDCFRKD